MCSLNELQKAQEKYSQARKRLEDPQSVESLSVIAQQAQDAWNELKKTEVDFNNTIILKKMEMMYGC